ncbi:unnamed protein product [Sphagnum compactum]
MDMLALPFLFIFFSFFRGDDVHSLRIQSGGSSISHNAMPLKVYDSRNWRISRSSSSSCAATSPRSAVRSRRIVERRRGVTKKKKKKKMEASLTTGEAGENFLLLMKVPATEVLAAINAIENAKVDPSNFLQQIGGRSTRMLIFTVDKELVKDARGGGPGGM